MRRSDLRKSPLVRRAGIPFAGLLAVAAVACAETTPSAPGPAAPAAAGTTTTTSALKPAPELSWADMNKQQRIDYMKAVVVPRMKQVFVAFNPDRYAKMNCTTCHGDSATDGTFKMPNPKLPKLPNSPAGFKQLAADKPAVMDFMKNEVKPKMAALLGEPEYNPETKSGFGCIECHTMAP
jgi:hypothetical protein